MRVCIFHKRMGSRVRAAVEAAFPDVEVRVVHDTTRDPDERERIDVLFANIFPPGLLRRCPRLRWLHLTSSGVEQVAAEAPLPELLVTHSRTVPARAVAEFVWMGLLGLAKQAPRLRDQQRARLWCLPDAQLVAGTRLVLVGLGYIGSEIARRAAAFDVAVTAVTRHARPSPLADAVLLPEALAAAALTADHLVLAVPAHASTRHLVDDTVLRALPASATLINVARPSVVDIDALVQALRAGRLAGALLDVHDEEPLPPTSPLWDVDNLWLTPHAAYCYPGEEDDIATLFVDNLRRWRAGEALRNRVACEELQLPAAATIAGQEA